MPTTTLSGGLVYTIADTVVRALPPGYVRLFVTFQTATSIDLANDLAMSNPQNYVPGDMKSAGNAGIFCSAGFIRVNAGSALVSVETADQ